MINLISNFFTKGKILIICMLFVITPLVTYNVTNVIGLFISSNYISTVLNLLYLVFAYTRTGMFEELSTYIIQRTGKNKYNKIQFGFAFGSLAIYCILLYGSSILFFDIPIGYENMFIVFLLVNTLVYMFEELIILLQVGSKKNILYLIIPILINFIFRYAFVIPWATKVFN